MKSIIFITAIVLSSALFFTSCDMSVLNKRPLDQISEEDLWEDSALMEQFVNDMYLGMGHGLYEVMLSAKTDEAHFIHGYGTADIVQANVSPSNRGSFDDGRFSHYEWGALYLRIRQANVFLDRIDDSAVTDNELKERMIGEVHFLRAYFYHNLLRMYGGVPIITEPYALDDNMEVARNSFAETVDFIVQEAEFAADYLPLVQFGDRLGRASAGAALALKARVLLYAASDLYHDNPSDMDVTGYTSGQDRQAFWRAAKEAAEAVINLGEYSLFRADPSPGDSTALNYYELFLTKDHSETIMSRYFIESRGDGYNPGLHNGPNGYHNWAGNTPIQNLVDDYQMDDGSEFNWSDPEHAAAPYENRDPRFYASILHDGAPWRERPSDVADIDPQNIIQTFNVIEIDGGGTASGVDTRDSPIEDWNGSYSRYYLKKFIDESVNHSTTNKQEVPWIFFRYGEVLLNYAEASIELGDEQEARDALNKIRRRAGMPEFNGTVTGEDLRDQYRNERRIEMAFEEQRYFDVRRWMLAPEVLNEPARGINIFVKGVDRSDRSSYYDYDYQVNESIQSRAWDEKMYFVPISQQEMNRNSLLIQNPAY